MSSTNMPQPIAPMKESTDTVLPINKAESIDSRATGPEEGVNKQVTIASSVDGDDVSDDVVEDSAALAVVTKTSTQNAPKMRLTMMEGEMHMAVTKMDTAEQESYRNPSLVKGWKPLLFIIFAAMLIISFNSFIYSIIPTSPYCDWYTNMDSYITGVKIFHIGIQSVVEVVSTDVFMRPELWLSSYEYLFHVVFAILLTQNGYHTGYYTQKKSTADTAAGAPYADNDFTNFARLFMANVLIFVNYYIRMRVKKSQVDEVTYENMRIVFTYMIGWKLISGGTVIVLSANLPYWGEYMCDIKGFLKTNNIPQFISTLFEMLAGSFIFSVVLPLCFKQMGKIVQIVINHQPRGKDFQDRSIALRFLTNANFDFLRFYFGRGVMLKVSSTTFALFFFKDLVYHFFHFLVKFQTWILEFVAACFHADPATRKQIESNGKWFKIVSLSMQYICRFLGIPKSISRSWFLHIDLAQVYEEEYGADFDDELVEDGADEGLEAATQLNAGRQDSDRPSVRPSGMLHDTSRNEILKTRSGSVEMKPDWSFSVRRVTSDETEEDGADKNDSVVDKNSTTNINKQSTVSPHSSTARQSTVGKIKSGVAGAIWTVKQRSSRKSGMLRKTGIFGNTTAARRTKKSTVRLNPDGTAAAPRKSKACGTTPLGVMNTHIAAFEKIKSEAAEDAVIFTFCNTAISVVNIPSEMYQGLASTEDVDIQHGERDDEETREQRIREEYGMEEEEDDDKEKVSPDSRQISTVVAKQTTATTASVAHKSTANSNRKSTISHDRKRTTTMFGGQRESKWWHTTSVVHGASSTGGSAPRKTTLQTIAADDMFPKVEPFLNLLQKEVFLRYQARIFAKLVTSSMFVLVPWFTNFTRISQMPRYKLYCDNRGLVDTEPTNSHMFDTSNDRASRFCWPGGGCKDPTTNTYNEEYPYTNDNDSFMFWIGLLFLGADMLEFLCITIGQMNSAVRWHEATTVLIRIFKKKPFFPIMFLLGVILGMMMQRYGDFWDPFEFLPVNRWMDQSKMAFAQNLQSGKWDAIPVEHSCAWSRDPRGMALVSAGGAVPDDTRGKGTWQFSWWNPVNATAGANGTNGTACTNTTWAGNAYNATSVIHQFADYDHMRMTCMGK